MLPMRYVGQLFKGDVDHAGNIGLHDAHLQSRPVSRKIRHNRTFKLRKIGPTAHLSLKSDDARTE